MSWCKRPGPYGAPLHARNIRSVDEAHPNDNNAVVQVTPRERNKRAILAIQATFCPHGIDILPKVGRTVRWEDSFQEV